MQRIVSSLTLAATLCLTCVSAQAQTGNNNFMSGTTAKLFGSNTTFSASVLIEFVAPGSTQPSSMPAKIATDQSKSRFEMKMSEIKSSSMPAAALDQMKTMGMDQMVTIARPDKKELWILYPDQQAYVITPLKDSDSSSSTNDYKVETSSLGTETIDGHPCAKNKVVVTDKQNQAHQATVWNATDLKNFPIRIQMIENNTPITMTFSDVSLAPPSASSFELPSGYTKYDNMQALVQQAMMKKAGGSLGNTLGGFMKH
jgi:hypothetical protein